MSFKDYITQIKKSVVFIGKRFQNPLTNETINRFIGTGVLIIIQGINHIITAKHVIIDPQTNDVTKEMGVFYNKKNGNIGFVPLQEINESIGFNWIFHTNFEVDLAISPYSITAEQDVIVIPEQQLLTIENLFETKDVFFISYQPGLENPNKIVPIIRKGAISLIKDDKSFYVDGFAFPGNSGSPVFVSPSPISFDQGGISIGGDKHGDKMIGIISSYLPYNETAISRQTGRVMMVTQENTGLSEVWSLNLLKEICEYDEFKSQIDAIKKRLPQKKVNSQ